MIICIIKPTKNDIDIFNSVFTVFGFLCIYDFYKCCDAQYII